MSIRLFTFSSVRDREMTLSAQVPSCSQTIPNSNRAPSRCGSHHSSYRAEYSKFILPYTRYSAPDSFLRFICYLDSVSSRSKPCERHCRILSLMIEFIAHYRALEFIHVHDGSLVLWYVYTTTACYMTQQICVHVELGCTLAYHKLLRTILFSRTRDAVHDARAIGTWSITRSWTQMDCELP